jgi:hypothetical protein
MNASDAAAGTPTVRHMTGSADVLVVGVGPTGLSLAAHGMRPWIIDLGLDRVHESRALAIQPRTLEVLAGDHAVRVKNSTRTRCGASGCMLGEFDTALYGAHRER